MAPTSTSLSSSTGARLVLLLMMMCIAASRVPPALACSGAALPRQQCRPPCHTQAVLPPIACLEPLCGISPAHLCLCTPCPSFYLPCSYEAGTDAHVLFSVGVAPGSDECAAVMQRLNERGYPTTDLSEIELAQVGWAGRRRFHCGYSVQRRLGVES